jgi:hypothetical protein
MNITANEKRNRVNKGRVIHISTLVMSFLKRQSMYAELSVYLIIQPIMISRFWFHESESVRKK